MKLKISYSIVQLYSGYIATFPRNSIDISADASQQNVEMEDSAMDKLQSAIEDILRTCSTDEITRIATILKISDEDLEGKGQRRILRLIGNIIDEFANDEKLAIFEGIAKEVSPSVGREIKFLLTGKEPVVEDEIFSTRIEDEIRSEGDEKRKTRPDTKLRFEGSPVEFRSPRKFPETPTVKSEETEALAFLNHLKGSATLGNSIFTKDFKIQGLIGDPSLIDEKKRLDYISLCCQLSEGRAKGYSDAELAIGVRHACVPGSYLRRYLDGKGIIPIGTILESIRSVYEEKSASQLYGQLYNLVQNPNETSAAFVLRALSVKQQVLITSAVE